MAGSLFRCRWRIHRADHSEAAMQLKVAWSACSANHWLNGKLRRRASCNFGPHVMTVRNSWQMHIRYVLNFMIASRTQWQPVWLRDIHFRYCGPHNACTSNGKCQTFNAFLHLFLHFDALRLRMYCQHPRGHATTFCSATSSVPNNIESKDAWYVLGRSWISSRYESSDDDETFIWEWKFSTRCKSIRLFGCAFAFSVAWT